MYDYYNVAQQNEKLRTLLSRAESNLHYEQYQNAHERNQLRVQLREWQAANEPGGWIDDMRKEIVRLRAIIERNKISF